MIYPDWEARFLSKFQIFESAKCWLTTSFFVVWRYGSFFKISRAITCSWSLWAHIFSYFYSWLKVGLWAHILTFFQNKKNIDCGWNPSLWAYKELCSHRWVWPELVCYTCFVFNWALSILNLSSNSKTAYSSLKCFIEYYCSGLLTRSLGMEKVWGPHCLS